MHEISMIGSFDVLKHLTRWLLMKKALRFKASLMNRTLMTKYAARSCLFCQSNYISVPLSVWNGL